MYHSDGNRTILWRFDRMFYRYGGRIYSQGQQGVEVVGNYNSPKFFVNQED